MTGQSDRPIVDIRHFSMSFGDKQVVKDLSFTINRGEVFGLLGSNGSGKTTTLRALLGIYKPNSGELLINGQPFDVAGSTRIGYLPEERGLYKKESVIDVMTYFGQLKGMSRKEAVKFSLDYLKQVDLLDHANTKVSKLSGGQQQKVQLGIAIMNNPELLILDEPTKGFDPVNRRLLMDIVFELHRHGATVIMVSHQMDEVEKICDRILLLKDGVAYEYGTVSEIKAKHHGASIDDIFVDIYGRPDETNLGKLLQGKEVSHD
ncbi:MAG: ATP-binding cassette domain-containing protein [Candidatus Saccharibacteria bacterium]|nr:ATP-binding cassette domain-containing protein [Candidatus Saccharibacteria bacterium]